MTRPTYGWNVIAITGTGRWRPWLAAGIRGALVVAAIILAFGATSIYLSTTVAGQSAGFANFEGAQTNPIRLSPDGTRLFAVNTANASLSVFDISSPSEPVLIGEIPVGLEPVSVNARTSDEAWVVNQLSDSVSIVSVSRGIVTATLNIPDEPMDVVFAGVHQAYVSVSRSNAVVVLDTLRRTLIRVLPLFGENPRALAVSPDGSRVYAAFALSGNATTVIRNTNAPPPPPPTNPRLPPAPQVAKIVSANDREWSSIVNYRMPDNDVAVIESDEDPRLIGYYSGVGTVNLGLAVNPVNGDLFVANTEARNLVQFEPNLRGHWVDNRITRVHVSTAQVTPFDLNPSIDYSVLPNPAARATALAQPTAVAFDPGGEFMHVAAFGTDRVAKVDTNGNVLSFVEVSSPNGSGARADPGTKRGPRGLALHADGRTLYVLNRISSTISVIDTLTNSVIREIPVGTDATPVIIRTGRGFLYDAKLSGNGTGSCASCHVDGDMDMLAWDLGNPGGEMSTLDQMGTIVEFHPMKGPMTTQTLRGLAGAAPLHWRGDKANFLEFNPAFDALMGGVEIPTADMLAYEAFINTILFQPNPNQNLDRTLPSSLFGGNAVTGVRVFLTVGETRPGRFTCAACHRGSIGTTHFVFHFPGDSQQPLKIPHLRNMYQKQQFNRFRDESIGGFGMDHEGHMATFRDFFSASIFAGYSLQQKADLAAFMLSFDTGTAPAVGYAVTLTAGNVADGQLQTDWTTLQQQARGRNIDLVVKGTIKGQVSELVYRPLFDDYAFNAFPSDTLDRAQLQALVQAGDTLTVMGVPLREGLTPTMATPAANDPVRAAVSVSRSTNRGH